MPVQYPEGIKAPNFQKLKLVPFPDQYTHYLGENHFQFLNLKQNFKEEINWNYLGHGKLWAYHLNYFDYLHQPEMEWETGKALIESFLQDPQNRPEGMDPYPISLRTINWIKFFSKHDRYPQEIVDSLYGQYQVLTKKLEYHLLGNHLLENGFSLLFGVVFFQDEKLIRLARKILKAELKEQILEDGAHFELSPMYHVILLQRALDGYNLLIHNNNELQDVEQQLKEVIQKMVNWLYTIMFSNGDIPMFNDSADGQALEPKIILSYAQQFGFTPKNIELKESGYRKFEAGDFEIVADVGEVGPNYQPGHAHSDALSFVLYHQGKPIIVDRGISTYEKNQTREEERSTASHNTIVVNGKEQTDVWGGFRVGRRAKPVIITDGEDHLKATHTGYDYLGINHIREWKINDHEIVIRDEINGGNKESVAYIHLHPDIKPVKIEEGVFKLKSLILTHENLTSSAIEKYSYCTGFNKKKDASCLKLTFDKEFKTHIISN
ncbi:heparinase II/III family protein [Gracilimonas halophila]|uniref:Heparinase II/III family protein n=1 Tax=Gracilimonas halophila TaxID=1834464 RepID=A0ABW5JLH1_9BACT